MTVNEEIEQALRDEYAKDNPPLPYGFWDKYWDFIFWQFHPKLNDPVWLTAKYHDEHLTEQSIAKLIGCSDRLVHKKLLEYDIITYPDRVFDVYTGFFHSTKRFIALLAKPYIKWIQQGIETVYSKTKSRNAALFKEIIAELEAVDEDTGVSVATWNGLGLSRKEAYVLAAKFFVCLYEYDNHYSERIDHVLYRILEAKERIYLDNQHKPENWYPHRDKITVARYMVLRNQKSKE